MNGLPFEVDPIWKLCLDTHELLKTNPRAYTRNVGIIIATYLERNSYEEAMLWTFVLLEGRQVPELCFFRCYISVKMCKSIHTELMENIRNRFKKIHNPDEIHLFMMADMEYVYGDYDKCSALIFKIDHDRVHHFDFQLKRLTFDLMWKQQKPFQWTFLLTDPVPLPVITFCNAIHHMRLHHFRRAIVLFEKFIVDYSSNIASTVIYEAQEMLLECYERADEIISDMSFRFHLCGQCNGYIDREPLWKRDTDCFVCSVCRIVPYCSVECHDKHWPVHKKVCGQKYDKKHITMFPNLGEVICSQCYTVRPSKVCTRCNNAFYCDQTCQKKHWSNHKIACVPSNSTGK